VPDSPAVKTILFTDIEGSSRLWEREPERMAAALAGHDRLLRDEVGRRGGSVVKSTGDGMLATFRDPHGALAAVVALQRALRDVSNTGGLPLRVRAGLHAGVVEDRDGDSFGNAVNRAARVTTAAHGGQVLATQAVAELVRDGLPDGITLRDLGTVRLRDLLTPERVYQVEQDGLPREFPALRTLESIPNNLPQQLSTFVGREHELAAVKEELAGTRLLTLFGIGGVGKTRLSLQVAAEAVSHYPDGVWFVELAPISDARLVPQTVASALGVREEAGRSIQDALLGHVKDRTLLIVLDNCEHVIDACAALVHQMLQASAGVRILASSRERFNIAGETVHPVPPLALPTPGDNPSADNAGASEAVRLFVERARGTQPAFALNDRNTPAVVEICRRLDGIPLALELAAARLRALPVEEIAARVNDRFRLLASGDRTALPRQKTLRALIDWSHDLLSEPERVLLRRLAVFAGGFTLDAAEAVAAGDEIAAGDVLELLTGLVDKSLVTLDADAGRYAMLETVRQYAMEKLDASGDGDPVRERHLDFHLAMVEGAAAGLAGPEQPLWLERLDRTRENILAAHAWSLRAPDDCARSYRLVYAIRHYWFLRGMLELGHRITLDTAAGCPSAHAGVARGRALWAAGQICAFMARYTEAQVYLEESLRIARAEGERRMVAGVLNTLALATFGQGDAVAAREKSEEALAIARDLNDERRIAMASNALAHLHRFAGRLDAAEPLYDEALGLSRKLGDHEMEAVGLLNLAMVAIGRSADAQAVDLLRQVLAIATETQSRQAMQSFFEVAAGFAASMKDWERAARLFGTAERHMNETGIRRDPADEAFLSPWLARAGDALGREQFARQLAAGGSVPFDKARDEAGDWLAELAGLRTR
jgi:predicted ATPase/class 3 adenylate cyclase